MLIFVNCEFYLLQMFSAALQNVKVEIWVLRSKLELQFLFDL